MLNPSVNLTPQAAVEGEMESRIDALVDVLWKEVEVYRELREAVGQEHRVLLKPSLEALNESNSRKETCVLKTRLLEEVRSGITERIAACLGIGQDEVTLSRLLACASPRQRQRLGECQSVLRSLVTDIAGMNGRNSLLIESSLRFNEGAMQFLSTLLAVGTTYAGTGRMKTDGYGGRFCSERG